MTSQMIFNNVHSNIFLPRKGLYNVIGKEVMFFTQRLKNISSCLFTYKMHTYRDNPQEKGCLRTLNKSLVSTLGKHHISFITSSEKHNNIFQEKSSHSLHGSAPFKAAFSRHIYFHKHTLFFNLISTLSERPYLKEQQVRGKNKSSRAILSSTSLSRSRKAHSLALCRKRIRQERLRLLKRCVSPIWRGHPYLCVNQMVLKKNDVLASTKNVSQNTSKDQESPLNMPRLSNQTRFHGKSLAICKGFTNALMRDGRKLRYQTFLRKALLATLPDIS